MMIVMQPMLQFAHKGKARMLGVEGEAMEAIYGRQTLNAIPVSYRALPELKNK